MIRPKMNEFNLFLAFKSVIIGHEKPMGWSDSHWDRFRKL